MHVCVRMSHKTMILTPALRLKCESRPEARSRRTTRSKISVMRHSSPCIKIGKTLVAVQVGGRNIGMTAERDWSMDIYWRITFTTYQTGHGSFPCSSCFFFFCWWSFMASHVGNLAWLSRRKGSQSKAIETTKRSNLPDFLISVGQTARKWPVAKMFRAEMPDSP